jgi:REP element-mobilizing transposase RayT
MTPVPLYRPADLSAAFQLRYGWTGWPSREPLPHRLLTEIIPRLASAWEKDGLRVLESSIDSRSIQLTLSATPQVSPVTLAARVKGRIQYQCRQRGAPIDFSRKVCVRSIGDPTRQEVEGYIRSQVVHADLADERFRLMLSSLTVTNPKVDLSQPTPTASGRYWYNLHLALVTSERYRIGEAEELQRIRDTTLRICAKKGYAASTLAVLPDHLHVALRGAVEHSPEEIALSFLNNLAHVMGGRPIWQAGFYAGTFGEYGMASVRETAES